jgi:hypothetical protein
MPSDSLPDLSPEQLLARKFAAQELAKYCEEFYHWRRTKQGSAALNRPLPTQGPLPLNKPTPPAPRSSA